VRTRTVAPQAAQTTLEKGCSAETSINTEQAGQSSAVGWGTAGSGIQPLSQ
jgi:hypothetical protein